MARTTKRKTSGDTQATPITLQSIVRDFLADRCDMALDRLTPVQDVYAAYKDHCMDLGTIPANWVRFRRVVEGARPGISVVENRERVRCFKGVGLLIQPRTPAHNVGREISPAEAGRNEPQTQKKKARRRGVSAKKHDAALSLAANAERQRNEIEVRWRADLDNAKTEQKALAEEITVLNDTICEADATALSVAACASRVRDSLYLLLQEAKKDGRNALAFTLGELVGRLIGADAELAPIRRRRGGGANGTDCVASNHAYALKAG